LKIFILAQEDYMDKEIHLIQKLIEHLGKEIKVQVIITCSIDGCGRRYESKGTFLHDNSSNEIIT
jgi:hypothetical protein